MMEIISKLAESWENYGIEYAVCHGIENFPGKTGRDIDIIVNKKHVNRIISISSNILIEQGFELVIPHNPWNARYLFAKKKEKYLELDFIHLINYGPLVLVTEPLAAYKIGPFNYDPWAMFVKTGLFAIVNGVKRPWLNLSSQDFEIIDKKLKVIFSKFLATLILEAFRYKKESNISKIRKRIKQEAILNSIIKPSNIIKAVIPFIKREILPHIRKVSPVISISGIDGVGKSTLIENLSNKIPNFFTGIVFRNWRPGFLPPLHEIFHKEPQITRVNNDIIIPRSKPGRFQFIRQLYYCLDFLLGHYIKDRFEMSRLKPVIYDRSYLDNFVNPERFGFKKTKFTFIISKIFPKPDLSILLYSDPYIVYNRKRELPLNVLELHQRKWFELFSNGEIKYAIYGNRNPEVLSKEVGDLISRIFFDMHSKSVYSRLDQQNWFDYSFNGNNSNREKKSYLPRYKLFHFKDGRGFIFDLSKRKYIKNSLSLYPQVSKKAQLLIKYLKLFVSFGIFNKLFNDVDIEKDLMQKFLSFISNILNIENEIFCSISLGAPGPRRKLVFKIMDKSGASLAYVKLATTSEAIKGLRNEANMLEFLNQYKLDSIEFPRILYKGNWNKKYCVLTNAINNSNSLPVDNNNILKSILSFSTIGFSIQKLKESSFYIDLSKSISKIGNLYFRHLCENACHIIENISEDLKIPFHFCHGDFTVWNLIYDGNKLHVFDLEYALKSGPGGYDIIRYYIQKGILIDKLSFSQIHEQMTKRGILYRLLEEYLNEVGINSDNIDHIIFVIYGLYLIHIITLYENTDKLSSQNIQVVNYLLSRYVIYKTFGS